MKNKKSRGISPVIATIIMVAVAIVMSIAAAFWMTGLMGAFTKYESIAITQITIERKTGKWDITIVVNNTGTFSTTISAIYIDESSVTPSDVDPKLPYTLTAGAGAKFTISGWGPSGYKSGRVITVKIVTATGNEYYRNAVLP
ncbi:MAG: archaellin/type IV pilin N-terminal domain-containing protein [Nitrososphaerota archaeon]|nr:archaellin/type IV pilin N-terminal domain-containing protein [Nitrososphaerota archaeon]